MTRTARTLRVACIIVAAVIGTLLLVAGTINAGLVQPR